MTEEAAEPPPPKRPMFRPEAVEHHAKARVGGRRLHLDDGRVAWQFRGLLVLIAGAAVLAFTIRTETSANVPAVLAAGGRRAYVVLPEGRVGMAVRVEARGQIVTGRVVEVEAAGTLVVALDPPIPGDATQGRAVVPLGRRSVAALLLGWGR